MVVQQAARTSIADRVYEHDATRSDRIYCRAKTHFITTMVPTIGRDWLLLGDKYVIYGTLDRGSVGVKAACSRHGSFEPFVRKVLSSSSVDTATQTEWTSPSVDHCDLLHPALDGLPLDCTTRATLASQAGRHSSTVHSTQPSHWPTTIRRAPILVASLLRSINGPVRYYRCTCDALEHEQVLNGSAALFTYVN